VLAHVPYIRVVIYAYKYADTNNEHAVVSQLSSLEAQRTQS